LRRRKAELEQAFWKVADLLGSARAAQLSTMQLALKEGGRRLSADDLEEVLPLLLQYVLKDAIRGWLFCASASGLLSVVADEVCAFFATPSTLW
jgi:hypothetical protein